MKYKKSSSRDILQSFKILTENIENDIYQEIYQRQVYKVVIKYKKNCLKIDYFMYKKQNFNNQCRFLSYFKIFGKVSIKKIFFLKNYALHLK